MKSKILAVLGILIFTSRVWTQTFSLTCDTIERTVVLNQLAEFRLGIGSLTGGDLDSMRVTRTIHQMNSEWSTSMCVDLTCYAPDVSVVDFYLPYPTPTDFLMQLDIYPLVTEGTSIVTMTVENLRNGENHAFTLTTHGIVVDIDGPSNPDRFALHANYPNPFNPLTHIGYELPSGQVRNRVMLAVYDLLGRKIRTLVDESQPAGFHYATWDGRNESGLAAASGVYFYKLTYGSFNATRKMLLIK